MFSCAARILIASSGMFIWFLRCLLYAYSYKLLDGLCRLTFPLSPCFFPRLRPLGQPPFLAFSRLDRALASLLIEPSKAAGLIGLWQWGQFMAW